MNMNYPRRLSRREKMAKRLSATIILFFFSGFLLIALKPTQAWQWNRAVMVFAVPFILHINMNVLPKYIAVDSLIMSIVSFLCALGVLILYSTNIDRGIQQAVYYGIGTVFMLLCFYFVRYMPSWDLVAWILFPLSIVLLAMPLLFGREINGAKNWIIISGMSLQPSEFVKISLLILCAFAMSRYKIIPWIIFLIISIALLMLQKDLGAVLLYFISAIIMFYASSGSLRLIALSMFGGAGAAVFAYFRFSHIKKRVAIWQNPWADYENSGYQLVQSLVAIASGGILGMGLGLGNPSVIPIYYTDFIFSVICEQFGIIFGGMVLALYAIFVIRGTFIAQNAQTRFHSLLALGCTTMLCVQTFVIIGGVIKLIPLTGVTMPFVSYGGSSLVSSMGLVGILQGVASYNGDQFREDLELARQDNPVSYGGPMS